MPANNKVATQSETKTITQKVLARIDQMKEEQELSLPVNYNVANALNSAYLALQKVKTRNGKNALEACTPTSISKALLDMTLQGLSPAKDQCYFIAYGNELQMQRSYFGTVAAVKRLDGVQKVRAEVVHQDDEFEIGSNDDMELIVKKFVPKFENQDKPIIGAFALIKTDEGNSYTVMTKKEIDQSWSQTRQKNNRVQKDFSQEMAKRTVLNRAAKMFINTSDDSDLLTGAINDTTENEYDDEARKDVTPVEETSKAELLANKFKEQSEPVEEGDESDGNQDEAQLNLLDQEAEETDEVDK